MSNWNYAAGENNGSFIYAPSGVDRSDVIDVDVIKNMFAGFGPGLAGFDKRLGKGRKDVCQTILAAVTNKFREGARTIVSGRIHNADLFRKTALEYGYKPYIIGEDRAGWETITTSDIDRLGVVACRDLNGFDEVVVVGDVQSCAAPLRKLVKSRSRNAFYVFCGDLFDRGPNASGVLSTVRKLNHVTVKGNHERNMDEVIRGDLSKKSTVESFDNISKAGMLKALSREMNSTVPFYAFEVAGREYWVTHGGVVGHAVEAIRSVNAEGIVEFDVDRYARSYYMFGSGDKDSNYAGIGDYSMDERLLGKTMSSASADIQFHGHRNQERLAADAVPRIGIMESRVERNGWLTAAVITKGGVDFVTV